LVEAEESSDILAEDQIQKIFFDLHKRLNISVDLNSNELSGAPFWTKLESDLIRSLEISSIKDIEQGRKNLSVVLDDLLTEEAVQLSSLERENLLERFVAEYFGLGVLDILWNDSAIFEILINSFAEIYVEKRGKLQRSPLSFWSDAHLKHAITRLCTRNNIQGPSEESSILKFMMPDNSAVTILFPPVTVGSPSVTISRFTRNPITIDKLIQFGTITTEMLQFLKYSVEAQLTVLVCGHLGSGANTIVNVLSSYIPGDERVISIEYENHYSLRVNHLIKLLADDDPTSENSFGKLLSLTRRIRGDRLVLGEFFASEAYEVLNTVRDGFSGSIIRLTATSPADAINRLETFVQLHRSTLPPAKINELVTSSIDLIVYQERLRDGTRAVTSIVEVLDAIDSNGHVVLKELFGIEETGVKDGRILRKFITFGKPSANLTNKIESVGIELPPGLFQSAEKSANPKKLSESERRAIKFSKGKYAFISYARDDRNHVGILAKELEDKGFDVWLDVSNIKPGEEWTKILENAIKNAGAFLVILTPAAANSQFVRNEIIMAQDEKLPIIPVKMEECDIPIQIRALQYVLYDKSDMAATVNLISETLSKHISNAPLSGEI